MSSFGTSAPGPDAYKHFGITADAIAEAAKRLVAITPFPHERAR
jgi:transketolase